MSTLIIGGLFVVALIALVALFFVLQGERRAAPATPAMPKMPTSTPSSDVPDTTPTSEPGTATPGEEVLASAATQTAEATPTPQPVAYTEPETYSGSEVRVRLNGQFYELASSLRDLRQQATEMERRLNTLTDMIDTIERKQGSGV